MAEHGPLPGAAGEKVTALVLGVGGNVSQGIQKALSMGALQVRVVAACVTPNAAGLYLGPDRAYISPYADDPSFFEWLVEVCERERVDVVLSGVEPVLWVLAAKTAELRERTGAVALVSDSGALEVGMDKLRTAHWLAENGLNSPRTADAADERAVALLAKEVGLPLVAKPRRGKGGQGVMLLEDEADLGWARGKRDYVVQQLLGNPETEYTVGCFSDSAGRVRGTMAMRRTLQDGTTVSAEAGAFPDVAAEACRIAAALRPSGPCNVQLRMHEGQPVCFEINVRFSGTTPIRSQLGFNDVEAAIRHYALGHEATDLPAVEDGIALRYWNELYLEPPVSGEGALGSLEMTRPVQIEDFGRR